MNAAVARASDDKPTLLRYYSIEIAPSPSLRTLSAGQNRWKMNLLNLPYSFLNIKLYLAIAVRASKGLPRLISRRRKQSKGLPSENAPALTFVLSPYFFSVL